MYRACVTLARNLNNGTNIKIKTYDKKIIFEIFNAALCARNEYECSVGTRGCQNLSCVTQSPIISGIYRYLIETEDAAQSRLEVIVPALAKAAGATEALKVTDGNGLVTHLYMDTLRLALFLLRTNAAADCW